MLNKKDEGCEFTKDQIIAKIKKHIDITEVHIVGGVHPKMGLHYFIDLIKKIKN